MLSIRYGPEKEWWVSAKIFDRLFQSGLESGEIPPHLEHWRHVAGTNGGFDILRGEPKEAEQLAMGLRSAAEREVASLCNPNPASEDGGYRQALMRLLKVLAL
jgi:hypothetical protein